MLRRSAYTFFLAAPAHLDVAAGSSSQVMPGVSVTAYLELTDCFGAMMEWSRTPIVVKVSSAEDCLLSVSPARVVLQQGSASITLRMRQPTSLVCTVQVSLDDASLAHLQ